MDVAIIGVIGLVVGALLTGLLDYRAAGRERRQRAWVAASLIAAELDVAMRRLKSAADTQAWWDSSLPVERWKTNADALAVGTERALLDELAAVYAGLEIWDLDRAASNPRDGAVVPPTSDQIKELRADIDRLKVLRCSLHQDVTLSYLSRLPLGWRRGAAVVAVCLVAAPFVIAGLVQRPVETDATVAAALQEGLAKPALVACGKKGDGWRCEVDEPRGSCGLKVAGPGLDMRSVAVSYLVKAPARRCGPEVPPGVVEVDEGPHSLLATAQTRRAEKALGRAVVRVETRKQSWFDRRFSEWFGTG